MIGSLYDTIKIMQILEKIPKQAVKKTSRPFSWHGFIWSPVYKKGLLTYYKAEAKNLQLRLAGNELYINNSLHKFYHGNNYVPFTYQEVLEAIHLLNKITPVNILNAKVLRVSPGIVINENAQHILGEWQNYRGKTHIHMIDKGKIYGAKYYLTDYQVKGYDKTFEVKKHNQIDLKKSYFRFELDNCKTKFLNNKTNNIGIKLVKDLIDCPKFKKFGTLLHNKYLEIEKKNKISLESLSIKEKRLIAYMTNDEIRKSIKNQHKDSYKIDRKQYLKLIRNCHDSNFQKSVSEKIKEQINYSINN